ncbi:unnamed protein product [Nezara viridula]|uniref:Protein arginine N-methyltransferase n=1 Tax=Nezara viridula TaxID=85310 RepID=A0A9P0H6P4_NEZVI|nr:unnamed protein product [Nezara viridula]
MVKISCALDVSSAPNLKNMLVYTSENGFDHLCLPISHPRYKRIFKANVQDRHSLAFTRSEMILNLRDWNTSVIGRISSYIDVDSNHEPYRIQSEKILNQELMYISHLGIQTSIIKLHKRNNINLSRIIYDRCQENTLYQTNFNLSQQLWFEVPMESPKSKTALFRSDVAEDEEEDDPWDWWCEMRHMTSSDRRLGLALLLATDLPSQEVQNRWLGEPIKAVIIPTSIFLTNRKGYPVLSRSHQTFVKRCAALGALPIVTGIIRHVAPRNYLQYIDHVYQSNNWTDPVIPYTRGFEDHLQIPLQPLMDNLESHTYEIFEKDPVKYTEYKHAIFLALLDRVPPEEAETNVQVVMVVGAGRGPLVDATLMAASSAKRKVKVYCVEKNVNALVTLYSTKSDEWKDSVEVVCSDMRDWKPPVKCDILVSELLGSFGDNELSPECLDGAQHLLKDDGISIPGEYSSYLCPIQSCKLHAEAGHNIVPVGKLPVAKYEMPYVVHQLNTYPISPIQKAFTFIHPNRDEEADNRRFKTFKFKVEQDSVLHGFSGYFDTILYKDVKLSIVPESHSKGMFSWFPIYFPIKDPVKLKSGDDLVVHFWRLADKKSVWYEWCVSQPVQTPVHNPNGRSYSIGLL